MQRYGILWTYDGEHFRPAATHGLARRCRRFRCNEPVMPGSGSPIGRLLRGERLVQVIDLHGRRGISGGDPLAPRAWSKSAPPARCS